MQTLTTIREMTFAFGPIRHLLVDLDGVLYRGETALPDAARFITFLRAWRVAFRLVTNNSTLTPAQYVDKLKALDIDIGPQEVFTSALATALFLRDEAGGSELSVYPVGEDGLREALEGIGARLTDTDPHWVVAALDRAVTYDKLSVAALAIRAGARFVGTNPDTSLPTERGLLPGAGAIQAAISAATGVTPTVIGKPHPLMLRLAMEQLGGKTTDTAMLGDRLDTDIAGAASVDMPSILVLTGVSTRAELKTSEYRPSLVVNDLAELMARWDRRPE